MAGAVSLFLRILVFRTVASAFFPLVWQLWFSIGVMLFGTFAYWETVQHRLPNHRIIYRYMPTGLLQTVMMLFIGQQASKLLAIWQPDPGQRVLDEMVYLALPGVALTLLAMVGREGRRRDLTWGHRFAAVYHRGRYWRCRARRRRGRSARQRRRSRDGGRHHGQA